MSERRAARAAMTNAPAGATVTSVADVPHWVVAYRAGEAAEWEARVTEPAPPGWSHGEPMWHRV